VWKFDLEGIVRARLSLPKAHQIDLWPYVVALRCPFVIRDLYNERTVVLRSVQRSPGGTRSPGPYCALHCSWT
jgi:hypothetical protein